MARGRGGRDKSPGALLSRDLDMAPLGTCRISLRQGRHDDGVDRAVVARRFCRRARQRLLPHRGLSASARLDAAGRGNLAGARRFSPPPALPANEPKPAWPPPPPPPVWGGCFVLPVGRRPPAVR